MNYRRAFLPLVIAVGLFVIFASGYFASAQKKSGKTNSRKTVTTAPGSATIPNGQTLASQGGAEGRSRGTPVKAAVVRMAEVAQATAQIPLVQRVKDSDGPEIDIDYLPVPAGVQTKASANSAAASGSNAPAGQSGGTLVPSPAPLSSFQALPDGLDSIPPDTHGAVGPNHVMTALNTQVRIQDRNGNVLSTVIIDNFFNSLRITGDSNPIATFDPRVLYDPYQNRWIFIADAQSESANSSILIGVSANSDPTGSWFLYRVDADSTDKWWADYPTVGFNRNWIVVSANMFGISDADAPRTHIYAFNKANLYAHVNASFTLFDNASSALGSTIVPATTYDDTTDTMYLVNRWNSGTGLLKIFTITGPVGSEVFTPTLNFPKGMPWGNNPSDTGDFQPEAGQAALLDAGDTRMQSVVYRNGSLWTTHTIFLPLPRPNRSAVQWWQINPADGSVIQRGAIDDPTATSFYAYPSLAVNTNNDVLIGYSRFSATQFPSANYSFRAGSDPLNSLRADTVFKNGEGSYKKYFGGVKNRWGDYSNTVIDPVNQSDMWTVQEYASTPSAGNSNYGRWGTWWVRVRGDGSAPGPAPAAAPAPTPAATPGVPANDNFANAQTISSCVAILRGNNQSATPEAGEPGNIPASDRIPATDPKHSVWFKWIAPVSGNLEVNTNGSDFDTTLGIYTGLSAAQRIDWNDDGGDGKGSIVSVPVTAGQTYYISLDGWYSSTFTPPQESSGNFVLSLNETGCSATPSIQFSTTNFNVGEAGAAAIVTVTRTGSSGGTSTVKYATSDGTATQNSDYTTTNGTITFNSGETVKTFAVLINDDSYSEANEALNLTLSAPTNATLSSPSTSTLTIIDNDQAGQPSNAIDFPNNFVRQHYSDFLNREPDQGGLDYWTSQITGCGNDQTCIDSRRIGVSAAYFIELEYQATGSFVYRFYKAAFGVRPNYAQFNADRSTLVGGTALESAKQAFAADFVQRPEFNARYLPANDGADGSGFINALLQTVKTNSGVDLTAQTPTLKNDYATGGRALVLRHVSDNTAFQAAEYNKAFVLTQYFGYLRRDPEEDGFLFWLNVLNTAVPNSPAGYRSMVCAFITSAEYQARFGSIISHNDRNCPQLSQ
jgi:Calx-beta domain/Domain of unknown function (DUF4214)